MRGFGSRLRHALDDRGPLCAGIDPLPELLRSWGLPDSADGFREFAIRAVDALAPLAAVIKPQSAFFERHGAAGIAVLEEVIGAGRAAGALVLVDAKRGDIGSTMQGYADAYLDPSSPLAGDAITVSPFLGLTSLEPAFTTGRRHGAGVFVVVRTSNPGGEHVQLATGPTGGTVSAEILARIAELNVGQTPLGSIGAVVAGNLDAVPDRLAINGPLLVPGIGAQGGSAGGLARQFGDVSDLVVPSSSRDLLGHGPDQDALRTRFRSVLASMRTALA